MTCHRCAVTRFVGLREVAQLLDSMLCDLRHDFVYHGLIALDALQKRLVGLRPKMFLAEVGLI